MFHFLKKLFNRQTEKYFVSDAEKFLQEYDKKHPQKSDSQLREMHKHQRVAQLRDRSVTPGAKPTLWKDF